MGNILLRKCAESIDLSLDNLNFIFGNLIPPFEHGIHLYKTNGRNLLIFDSWSKSRGGHYTPSEKFLKLEEEIKKSGNTYFAFFHNHNYSELENDNENKLLTMPSNSDLWNNDVLNLGIVRNFRNFSDLRIFLNNLKADYRYPPRYFARMNTPFGSSTRVVRTNSIYSIEDEDKIEFEDNGYVKNSVLLQSMT